MPDVLAQASLPVLFGIALAYFAGLTIVSVPLGLLLERLMPRRRIMNVPLAEGQLRFELLGNLVFVAVAASTFTAVLASRAVRIGAPSLARDLTTFLALAVGFQIFYYALHRAMHHRSLVRFHRWHHRSHVTTPLSGQSMSFVEACGWMLGYAGLPLLMSLVVPIGFWGWIGYITFNVFGNIVGHSNVEMKVFSPGIWWGSVLAPPYMYHSLHHARWTGHYGFATSWVDRLFGTEWKDWPVLYRRIVAGQPIKSLKERG
jgi:Delta7-sterol 5-desaturase